MAETIVNNSSSSSEESSSESGDESFPQLNNLGQLATNLESGDSNSDSNSDIEVDSSLFQIDVKGSCRRDKNDRKISEFGTHSESSDDEYHPTHSRINKNTKTVIIRGEHGPSTQLEDGLASEKLYTNANSFKPGAKKTLLSSVATATNEELMKKSVVTNIEKQHTLPAYHESLNSARKKRQQERANSKGKNWFDMKAPEMTEEQKNELTVLQMRHVLDRKSFYKHNDLKVLPKFFQMGKVVEDAADFYNSRIPKKQRKQTLVDELLADAEFRKYNKRKYTEAVQAKSNHRGKLKLAKRMKKRKR